MSRGKPHSTKSCLNPLCLRRVWGFTASFCCRGCSRFFNAVKTGKSAAETPKVEHTEVCDGRNIPKTVTQEELREMLEKTPKENKRRGWK